MKHVSILLLLVVLLISVHAQARTEAEIQKDLIKAAKTAVKVYRNNGILGLIAKTQDCYDNAGKYEFYCVYLDLASRRIDKIIRATAAIEGINFPKTEFFDDELFGSRVAPVFIKANMDMERSNEYLRLLTPVINKLVEDNLLRNK
jgi:hypothetical protein